MADVYDDDPDDFQRGCYGPNMVDWQPLPRSIELTEEIVTAAAEAIEGEAIAHLGRDLGTIHRNDIVRAGLVAALAIVERLYEVTRREAVEHGLVGNEELPAVRWNPAAEEFFVDCLCGETFAAGRGGDALERALRHLAQVGSSPKES